MNGKYAGNIGQDDDLTRCYRYDSNVPNHKQLAIGDLVFIRDLKTLVGIARITGVASHKMEKTRARCPVCNITDLKKRETKLLMWRCSAGHEFASPNQKIDLVDGFEATYADSFLSTPDATPVAVLKAAALRPNDQLSIEEIDLKNIEATLTKKFPKSQEILARFAADMVLAPEDADHDPAPFEPTMSDERIRILKAIKLRRGQSQFRKKLVKRYGRCVVSGCELLDLLEAAHIHPYLGEKDNHIQNGLLLRADLHTLFDLHLMAIDPISFLAHFHPKVSAAGYASFDKKPLHVKANEGPLRKSLATRWEIFLETIKIP
ncbi:HNH endonuclease signature motif containing protein [Polaromonas sp.]|uniref:HNH endonuclease n=1 Tax=Polaromonas sp. TaxID=1869339 RepID=UPI002489F3AC|nr:HNH endonuclease signature motif containing protein [Polaromonas sp.]MDI1273931.1 HNH endonuclease signature motif containing protein [Polaromonas sp.]